MCRTYVIIHIYIFWAFWARITLIQTRHSFGHGHDFNFMAALQSPKLGDWSPSFMAMKKRRWWSTIGSWGPIPNTLELNQSNQNRNMIFNWINQSNHWISIKMNIKITIKTNGYQSKTDHGVSGRMDNQHARNHQQGNMSYNIWYIYIYINR